jgi:mono/diheme cytochrome c family protein
LLAQPSEGLNRGLTIYREHCMECHGATGKGDGPKAPFLSPRPGNLISAATSAKTDKELLRTIAQGKPLTAMPAWKDALPAEDQQAVLQYIRSLIQFSRSPAALPPTP